MEVQYIPNSDISPTSEVQIDPEVHWYHSIPSLDDYSTHVNIRMSPPNHSSADAVPSTLLVPKTVNSIPNNQTMLALMDSGSNLTLIHQNWVPEGCKPVSVEQQKTNTAAGTFQVQSYVDLHDISFPEFGNSVSCATLRAYIFSAPCRYALIVGRDFLVPNKMDVKFSTQQLEWFNRRVPMKSNDATTPLNLHNDDGDDVTENFLDNYANSILPSKYEGIESIESIVEAQHHLNRTQKSKLLKTLRGFHDLFNGKLGRYKHSKVKLRLKPGSVPKHLKPFPVPHSQMKTFKDEADRLCEVRVLEKCGLSEHAYPTFIVPKKDGRVRWVSDFRELNKMLIRTVYGIPRVRDIMARRKKYRYFTKLDLTMYFYTYELDEESQMMCVITTPFGKYKYLRLPMGICNSPDIAQEAMERIFLDMRDDEVETFIDDIGIFSMDFDEHMDKLKTVLTRLYKNGYIVNPLKCEWAVQETDWLGYWFTPDGLKPWSKKIESILRIKEPTTLTQLRSFIGMVNYYRDMWPKRAHLLAPLTALTGCKKYIWTDEHRTAFDALKAMIVQETCLVYPDHNKPFHIYTDASDYQLGSVIMQEDKPVAYFSRKLTPPQRNYTTIEKELLSVVATLREFHSILLGAELHVHTDHKNLTHTNLNTQRVLRWRMYCESFNPTFHYIKGEDNILADFLSRTPLEDGKGLDDSIKTPDDPDSDAFATPLSGDTTEASRDLMNTEGGKLALDSFFMDEKEMTDKLFSSALPESYLNAPPGINPISYQRIAEHQQNSNELVAARNHSPQHYEQQVFGGHNIWVHKTRMNDNNWRIYIPVTMENEIINWYHNVLLHPGVSRQYQSMKLHFYFPNMQQKIENYIRGCEDCVKFKEPHVEYGEVPPREAHYQPFYELAVDSIGPWKIQINGEEYVLNAISIIDTASTLVELSRVDNKTAFETARRFEQAWLYRYPRPMQCIYDLGTEFKAEFQDLLQAWNIKGKPTGVRSPQANAICERMHSTVEDLLRVLCHSGNVQNMDQANALLDHILATVSHALRSTVHRTLKTTPGAAVFNRDMLLDIPYVANWLLLREGRQQKVDSNLQRANNQRVNHDYAIGDLVYELVRRSNDVTQKLETFYRGPYEVVQVHSNGTLTIRRNPQLTDRIHIRKLRPKF